MPRPKRRRKVSHEPKHIYFTPVGRGIIEVEELLLSLDELEAIRLKDFLAMEQKEAALEMGISQPTFHRLLLSARRKVADTLVKGKAIKIHGGNFEFVKKDKKGR